jgi:DHA2 family multidrug resistance protein
VSLAIPVVRDYQVLLALHFVHGLLLASSPGNDHDRAAQSAGRWWIAGPRGYSFRLSFTGNAGVSLVGFYVQHLGWEWGSLAGRRGRRAMAALTWLGTPREGVDRQLLRQ